MKRMGTIHHYLVVSCVVANITTIQNDLKCVPVCRSTREIVANVLVEYRCKDDAFDRLRWILQSIYICE